MPPYSQDKRNISIKFDEMGKDDLLLSEIVEGTDALSEPFLYKLRLLSGAPREPKDMLGRGASIKIVLCDGSPRFVNGICSSFSPTGRYGAAEDGSVLYSYEAELAPQLWLASLNKAYRIFHEKTPLEIVKALLDEWGVKYKLSKGFDSLKLQALEQSVQYGESDFDFLSRHLESIGAFYRFEHAESSHVMSILDVNQAIPTPELGSGDAAEIHYNPSQACKDVDIYSWRATERVGVQEAKLRRYFFKDASTELNEDVSSGQSSKLKSPKSFFIPTSCRTSPSQGPREATPRRN